MPLWMRFVLLASLTVGIAGCGTQPEAMPSIEAATQTKPVPTASEDAPTEEVTVFPALTATTESMPEATSPPEYEALMAQARSEGTVRVIVTLDIPFQPEGDLGGDDAVRQQRAAIADAQRALITELEGTNFALVDQYETVPQMVLTVDEEALQSLIQSPLVSTISEDSLDSLSP